MERLIIITNNDMTKLMSMMFLDLGKYSFQQIDEGILIDFHLEDPDSIPAFINRFSSWFADESFLVNGDRYFKNHRFEEKWNIWKKNFRFIEAYRDEFYQAVIVKRLQELFFDFEEYYALKLYLEGLFYDLYDLTKLRMKVIEEHFTENIHEDYIVLCTQSQIEKELMPSN